MENCIRAEIPNLTVYAFSTENWQRAEDEVSGLINLMKYYLEKKIADIKKNQIRFKVIGDYSAFPKDVVTQIDQLIADTADFEKLTLCIALNYGARQEITNAVKAIATQVQSGKIHTDDITPDTISKNLMTADIPDPDLLIRSSGECRLSNYLLWQLSYTELYFTEILWPDFDAAALGEAIATYTKRHRRYGAN